MKSIIAGLILTLTATTAVAYETTEEILVTNGDWSVGRSASDYGRFCYFQSNVVDKTEQLVLSFNSDGEIYLLLRTSRFVFSSDDNRFGFMRLATVVASDRTTNEPIYAAESPMVFHGEENGIQTYGLHLPRNGELLRNLVNNLKNAYLMVGYVPSIGQDKAEVTGFTLTDLQPLAPAYAKCVEEVGEWENQEENSQ